MKKVNKAVESPESKVEGQAAAETGLAARLAKLKPAVLVDLPVECVVQSQTNPRKSFAEGPMQELAQSIKIYGVKQPGLARPIGKEKWEIVMGERRWRATTIAGRKTMPFMVQELDDQTTQELQLIENLQREDLDPLEEAQGYAELMRRHKYSVDDLVAVMGKKGKGRSSIFNALGLLKASKPVQEAMRAGKIDVYVANEIRKVPGEALQSKVLKQVLEGAERWVGNDRLKTALSVRATKDLIEANYQLELKTAPFDQKATYALAPGPAGPCAECPHRSGNARDTFPDIKNPDVCTHPECFGFKKAAAIELLKVAARERGQKVLTENEFRRGDFVNLDDSCYSVQGAGCPKWRALVKGQEFTPAMVEMGDGEIIEALPKDQAKELAKRNKHRFDSPSGGGGDAAYRKKQLAEQKKKKTYRAAAGVASAEILAKLVLRNGDLDSSLWKLLAREAVHFVSIEQEDFVAKRRGLSESINDSRGALRKWLKQNEDKPAECAQLVVELLLCAQWNGGGYQSTKWSGEFETAAKLAGVKLEKCLADAQKPKKSPADMTKAEFDKHIDKVLPKAKDTKGKGKK